MISDRIKDAVERSIVRFETSILAATFAGVGNFAVKYVRAQWADSFRVSSRLRISHNPALTWGTATYVAPITFPLSSALYGRVGLVTDFDPTGWRVFDATQPTAQAAYIDWIRVQPAFSALALTVHSTYANHFLRNKFREDFRIDCVVFHPDQEAEVYTDQRRHFWMAVTDWNADRSIHSKDSGRLANARVTILVDEEFSLTEGHLPLWFAKRQIEPVTESITPQECMPVSSARTDPNLPVTIRDVYRNSGYMHIYITP